MNFRNRIYRFMQGRNGVDALAKFYNSISLGCLFVAIVFTFISLICLRHEAIAASNVFRILYYVVYGVGVLFCVLWIVRILSRNVAKRQAENTRYEYRIQKMRRHIATLKQQWRDRKTYRYFRCPNCKQKIRAPRRKGKIRVTCSKCTHVFITKT